MLKTISASFPKAGIAILMIAAAAYFITAGNHLSSNNGVVMVFEDEPVVVVPVAAQASSVGTAALPKTAVAYRIAPQVVPISAMITPPGVTYREFPVYPEAARRGALEGTVIVKALIGDRGELLEARIASSSGSELFDSAAISSINNWRFSPAKRGVETIRSWIEVPFRFIVK